MSAAFKNVTIIAPDERNVIVSDPNDPSTAVEDGPRKSKYQDDNGDLTKSDGNGGHNKELSDEKGNWNIFLNGQQTGQYNGDWSPKGAPSWIDNLLYKNE